VKAAALVSPGHVEIVDVEEPRCGEDDVLVRVLAVGLCGSDLTVHSGARAVPATPWVLGHEGVGEVVAVGERVRDRQVGQRVAIEPNYCCFTCPPCRAGFTSACTDRVVIGINTPGLLAERVAVPAEFTFPATAHVPLADLVCAEPLTVARAAIRRSGVAAGDSCLVVGTGSQGLFLCLVLAEMGITPHVLEPHEGRRDLAVSVGAVVAGDSSAGFRFLFETSGVPEALAPALERLAPGGTAVLIGLSARPLGVAMSAVVYRQLTLMGSLIYDHPSDFAGTVAALENGKITPSLVLGAAFGFEETGNAFDAVRSTPGKCWIDLTA